MSDARLPIEHLDSGRLSRDKINNSFNEVVERVAGYRPHIENWVWWIWETNTWVQAEWYETEFQVNDGYIQYKSEWSTTWNNLIAVEDLKWDKWDQWDPFTYDDFTPEQLAGLKWEPWEDWDDWYTPVKWVDYFTQQDIDSLNIPEKVSDLDNDTGFITSASLPHDVGDLTNNVGYITSSALPTKTSDLTNDSGYITASAIPTPTDNLTSTSTSDPLSANQWRVLKGYIDNLMAQGKFLSLWDCTIWMPISFPLTTPYTYHTWDYFMVETIDTEESPTNYRPDGESYTWSSSGITELWEVAKWDYYIYDWESWLLATNHGKTVSFANLAWEPEDNLNLATALGEKQDNLIAGTNITIANDWKTISATDTTYTAWTNVQISNENVISATDTTYTASDFDIKDLADSTSLRSIWSWKQDAINDLSDIRVWAGLWATAMQPWDDISDLNNDAGYITSADLPTKVSDLENDSDFVSSSELNEVAFNWLTPDNAWTDISIAIGGEGEEHTATGTDSITVNDWNTLNWFKAQWWTYQWLLPQGYKQVEYLETDWTAAILTEHKAINIDRVDVKVSFSRLVSGNGVQYVVWWRTSSSTSSVAVWYAVYSESRWGLTYYPCAWKDNSIWTAVTLWTVYNISWVIWKATGIAYDSLTVDGTVKDWPESTTKAKGTEWTNRIALFWLWMGSGVWYIESGTRIHEAKFYDGSDTMVAWYIPCERESDNVLGVYDVISKTFLTQTITSGSFTKWNYSQPMPAQPQDIICNNWVIKASQNLFNPSAITWSTSSVINYTPIYVWDWIFTMSSPDYEADGQYTNIFFLPWNVSTGVNSWKNGVWKTRSQTRASVDGYVTVAERAVATGYNMWDPKDYHWSIIKHNENLLSSNIVLWGTINASWVDWTENAKRMRIEYQFLKKGTYTLSALSGDVNNAIMYTYDDANWTNPERYGDSGWAWIPYTFTLEKDCYVRFMCRISSEANITSENIWTFDIIDTEYHDYWGWYVEWTQEKILSHKENLFTGNFSQFDNTGWSGTTYTYFKLPKEDTLYTLYLICKKDYVWSTTRFLGFSSNGWTTSWVIWALSTGTTKKKWDIIKIINLSSGTYRNYVSMYSKAEDTFNYITEYFDIYLEEWDIDIASNTATAENLFKLSSNYIDEQEILWWNITRKVAVKVLTGDETWNVSGWKCYTVINGLSWVPNADKCWVCSHFTWDFTLSSLTNLWDKKFMYNSSTGTTVANWNFTIRSDDNFTTVQTCKEWLRSQYASWTPVILVYPLATATTSSVEEQTLWMVEGYNTYTIIQAWMEWLGLSLNYNEPSTTWKISFDKHTLLLPSGWTEGQVLMIVSGVPTWTTLELQEQPQPEEIQPEETQTEETQPDEWPLEEIEP